MTYFQKMQLTCAIVICEIVFVFAVGIDITFTGVFINFVIIGVILNIDNYIKFYKGYQRMDSKIDQKIAAFNERQAKKAADKEAAKNEIKG